MKNFKITEAEKLEILKKHNSLISEQGGLANINKTGAGGASVQKDYTVMDIQNKLIQLGYKISPDGILGPQTIKAYNDASVNKFQQMKANMPKLDLKKSEFNTDKFKQGLQQYQSTTTTTTVPTTTTTTTVPKDSMFGNAPLPELPNDFKYK